MTSNNYTDSASITNQLDSHWCDNLALMFMTNKYITGKNLYISTYADIYHITTFLNASTMGNFWIVHFIRNYHKMQRAARQIQNKNNFTLILTP